MNPLESILRTIGRLIESAIPIAFGLAVLGFFYGLAIYIFSAGNESKKEEGKNIMLWGLIALFIIASVFGIIRLFQGTLGIEQSSQQQIQIPSVNTGVGGGGSRSTGSGYRPAVDPNVGY